MANETERPLRVLIADDQDLMRSGFRLILLSYDGIDVVGEARDGFEAVELAQRLEPDVVLMDIRMPRRNGIEATRDIVANPKLPRTHVLILTTFDLDEYVYDALAAGASGFLLKDSEPDDIVDAVRIVAQGDALIQPSVMKRLVETFAASVPARNRRCRLGGADRPRARDPHSGGARPFQRRHRPAPGDITRHGENAPGTYHAEAGRPRPRRSGHLRLRKRAGEAGGQRVTRAHPAIRPAFRWRAGGQGALNRHVVHAIPCDRLPEAPFSALSPWQGGKESGSVPRASA